MPTQTVQVPNIGSFESVDVVEVLVSPGDIVAIDDSLITLESDKATLDVPSPVAGVITQVHIHVGDKVSEGTPICTIDVAAQATEAQTSEPRSQPTRPPEVTSPPPVSPRHTSASAPAAPTKERTATHASPSVRRFARELGANLGAITGSGPKGRIMKEDVQRQVSSRLSESSTGGSGIPPIPSVDFTLFGDIESRDLGRIRKLTAANVHRSWLNAPQVTHFDEADITDLEQFRKRHTEEALRSGFRLSYLPFLLRAAAAALRRFEDFNTSLTPDGGQLIYKKYVHIGIAVETPGGLVVPVIRNADEKGLFELGQELFEASERARSGRTKLDDFQGGCFTISSLGGIGGTGFTPIVNTPEVAILGVSKTQWKPVYDGETFVPRLHLPLALSYDHRVIDGAAAARFTAYLAELLGDIRQLLL